MSLCFMMVPRIAFLILAAISIVIAGCGRSMDRADLVFLNGAEPQSIDPAQISGQPEGRVVNALFEGLATYDELGQPQPGVAERWEISPDGRTYVFHLRADARWSNGDPVTASDFVWSWKRVLEPATAAEYASQLYYVRNAQPYNEGKLTDFTQVGVHAVDERTLKVELENPTAYFIDLCAFYTLAPVHRPTVEHWESKGESWTKPERLVCNGAYVMKEWRLFDRIRLEKNPHYWNRESVHMKTIDVLPTANRNTAFNFYATGTADLMMDKNLTPTAFLNELKKRPDFHSDSFLATYFIRFNTTRRPFNDPRVRLALSLVIDKELITEKITRAGERPAGSLTPPGAGGYVPPPGLKRDPELARKLLAEAGYPGGRNFPLVRFLTTGETGGIDQEIGVELQGMWERELGIRIQTERQEWKVYLESLSKMDYDMSRSSWVADYPDANTFLGMFVSGDGNNRTGWSNSRYDELIAAAAREPDRERRFQILQEAETILISEEPPICPLYHYVGVQLYDGTRLGGISSNPIDEHPLKNMYWKDRR